MGKLSQDVPAEQRPFFKIFEQIAYRHNYTEVFDDYLTMLINWFANGEQQEWRDQALKKYSPEEKKLFTAMYNEHIRLFHQQIVVRGNKWYDSLGDFYQTITSNYKTSAMGQFFTPQCICDMMAHMIIGDRPYQFINEPASGSGRMCLAAHAIQPLNYYWAIDKDAMCAKMTAINFCFHNCEGLVSQGDTLAYTFDKHYYVFRVQLNETTWLPYLKVVDAQKANEALIGMQELCRIMNGRPREKYEPKPELAPVEKLSDKIVHTQMKVATEQLKLF